MISFLVLFWLERYTQTSSNTSFLSINVSLPICVLQTEFPKRHRKTSGLESPLVS